MNKEKNKTKAKNNIALRKTAGRFGATDYETPRLCQSRWQHVARNLFSELLQETFILRAIVFRLPVENAINTGLEFQTVRVSERTRRYHQSSSRQYCG